MNYRIETREAFHVTGMQRRYQPGPSVDIPALWDAFSPQVKTIQNRRGDLLFGVCECEERAATAPSAAAMPPGFRYTAGAETDGDGPVPAGMIRVTVPGGRFAVFTHKGPASGIAKTTDEIWKRAIPAAGLKPTGAPDFEQYDERFNPDGGEMEIWVPIALGTGLNS